MLVRGPAPDYHEDDWKAKKAELTGPKSLDFPNVPYLIDEVNDIRLTESKSIMKYIAMKHEPSLLGRDAYEVGTCDMISRVHDDWYNELSKHGKSGDAEKLQETIDVISVKFSNFLKGKSFAVGEQLTFIDFSLFELVDYMDVYS